MRGVRSKNNLSFFRFENQDFGSRLSANICRYLKGILNVSGVAGRDPVSRAFFVARASSSVGMEGEVEEFWLSICKMKDRRLLSVSD